MNNKAFVLKTLLLIIAVGIVISSYNITSILMDYKESSAVYDEIASFAVEEDGEEKGDTKPGKTTPDLKIDFASLNKLNSDVKGWLYSENLGINYPVLQAEDNDKYLRADLYGNWLISGTVFVDYRCGEVGENKNYIIYGHNMDNGTMFGSFLDYRDQAYYEAHPTIDYLTPSGYHKIELVAGLVVNKTDVIYYPDPFKEDLDAYLAEALENSVFDSGLDFGEDDRLVILSTCSYEHDNARFVLIGRLAGG